MDEREALGLLSGLVDAAGDDTAIVDGLVLTIDMLHERTDFPEGVTRYTAGWRAAGASLSDLAAMGANAEAVVAAYGAPELDTTEIEAFVAGAQDVCAAVEAEYVGGDLDTHREFTVATAAIGRTDRPVRRSGASPGEGVFVTGRFGRTAVAIDRFAAGDRESGNELFRFTPRVAEGRAIADVATAMIDSSDGLARSLHQLADASGCGFAIQEDTIPVHEGLDATDERALFFGEDFELVFTAPETAVPDHPQITAIGTVTPAGLTIDDRGLPDRGYAHGDG